MVKNVYDARILPCDCGSTDVFIHHCLARGCTEPYVLQCNFCKVQSSKHYASWDEAVVGWNEERCTEDGR